MNALVWFGVLGGPLAWALVHVIGYGVGLAQCDDPATRWELPVHVYDVVSAAVGVAIAVAAELAALRVFRLTRESGNEPPLGRLNFLAVVGLTVNPLALAIMVMTGVGTAILPLCHQA